MRPITHINVFGVGRVARLAVTLAARRHRDVRFRLFSRNSGSHQPLPLANVQLCGLDALAQDGAPVVLCMASDEARILRALHDRPTGLTPRSAVAASNLRLLQDVIDPRRWCDRLVIVVTNPVELVCDFISRWTGNRRVFGFGMTSDRQRVREAIRHGFGQPAEQAARVEVTGFHLLGPIPLLSGLPELARRIESIPAADVTRNLAQWRPACGAAPAAAAAYFSRALNALLCRPRAHELIGATVNAITASEFRGSVPPVRRGAANLARLLSRIIGRKRLLVSGPTPGGHVLGGTLDLADETFRVPAVGPAEHTLLDSAMAEYDRLRHQHLR
jgi:hypothetical protein